MPLWADILIWVVAIMIGLGGWLIPIPWLDNRPFFRRTPSKAFRWFLVVVFLVLALSFVIYQCGRHIQVY
jgi:heme/copper-type cytochrome/quinol oxidase subunit 1